jgi:hypothetical protein
MDWQEMQRIQRDLIVPELEAWAGGAQGTTSPSGLSPVDRSPLWMIETIVRTMQHRIPLSQMGTLFRGAGWNKPAYDAMATVLSAKYGIIEGSQEQIEFIVNLESRLRALGPLDELDGTGPGKPTVVMRDDLSRLHNPDGAAVVFPDRGLYVLRGVHIPYQEWQFRDDAKLVLAVGNVEVRRALIERMGVRRWIKQAELKPTHADRFGTFYRIDTHDAGLGYVHVVCPSTRQDYFVPVPGNCRSAHEAVAWTFSMVPEDYDPAKEA